MVSFITMKNPLLILLLLTFISLPVKAYNIYSFVDATLSLSYQEYIVGISTWTIPTDSEQHSLTTLRKVFKYSTTKYNAHESARYHNFLVNKLKAFYTYHSENGLATPSELEALAFLQISAHNAYQGVLLGNDMTLEDAGYVLKSRMDMLINSSILSGSSIPRTELEIRSFADLELAKYGYDVSKINNYDEILASLKEQVSNSLAQ